MRSDEESFCLPNALFHWSKPIADGEAKANNFVFRERTLRRPFRNFAAKRPCLRA
jgi:hypothetical protein